MIVTKTCACGQSIEFEAEDLADLKCPHCDLSLFEQFAPPPCPRPTFDPPPEIVEPLIEIHSAPSASRESHVGGSFFRGAQLVLLTIIAALAAIIASDARHVSERPV